jgi:hypothetical protein
MHRFDQRAFFLILYLALVLLVGTAVSLPYPNNKFGESGGGWRRHQRRATGEGEVPEEYVAFPIDLWAHLKFCILAGP